MRILFVSSVLPFQGGVATWINNVSSKLRERGFETKTINAAGTGTSFAKLPSFLLRMVSLVLNSDLFFWFSYFMIKKVVKLRVSQEIRINKYDVIHAQDVNACNALYRYCLENNLKLILTVHGHFYNGGTSTRTIKNESWLGKLLLQEEKRAFIRANHVMTVSQYSYDFVSGFVADNKVSFFKNAVDIGEFSPLSPFERTSLRRVHSFLDDQFILFAAGRLVKLKGFEYIIRGMVPINSYPIKLLIAGEGQEKIRLQELVAELNISEKVQFLGEVNKDKMIQIYRLSDAFILASISDEGNTEGMPMAILEAMACGLPVIATSIGGVPEIVKDGVNGLLVNEKEWKEIAHAIKYLYMELEERKVLAANALISILEKHSLDDSINTIIEIYQKSY